MCSGSVLLLEHLVAESAFGRVDCQHLFEFLYWQSYRFGLFDLAPKVLGLAG